MPRSALLFLNCNHILITIDCMTSDDCSSASDTCISNFCHCGSNKKCSGRSDTCSAGICRCGETEECPRTEICWLGTCQGLLLVISLKM